MRLINSIVLLFVLAMPVYAQDVFLKTTGQPTTVCGDEVEFTIEVRNVSGLPLTNVVVDSKMPAGVNFERETSTTPMYVIGSPVNNPSFALGTIGVSDVKFIRYRAKTDCGLIAYLDENDIRNGLVNNKTTATYNSGVIFKEPNGSASYNVFYPVLTLIVNPADKDKPATRREEVTRSFTITNTGNGILKAEQAFVEITREQNLAFRTITGANLHIDNSTANKTILSFNDFGNGDITLDPGQSVTLVETVRVVDCGDVNLTTNYFAKWGCNAVACNATSNNSQDASLVRIFTGEPLLTVSSNEALTLCQVPSEIVFTFKNNKALASAAQDRANRAIDMNLNMIPASIVTLSDFKVLTKTGEWIPIVPIGANSTGFSFYNALRTMGNTIAGLTDIDGDGFHTDLMPQQDFKISAMGALSCPAEFADAKGSYYAQAIIGADFNARTSCDGPAFSYYNGNDFNNTFSSSKLTGPIDLLPGQAGTYVFQIDRYVSMRCSAVSFISDVTFPSAAYKVTEVKWIPSSGASTILTFTQDPNGTLHVNGGGNSGRFETKVVLDCNLGGASTPSSILEWKTYRDCGTCCRQFFGRETLEIFNHCGQGGTGACLRTESFKVERTTFGYPEPSSGFYFQLPANKLNRNSPNVRLNAGMETDIIEAIAKGSVVGGAFNNVHVEVQYISPINENIFEYTSGHFIVNTGSANQTLPIITPPVVTAVGDNYFFDFHAEGITSFPAGTSIELHANFKIKKSPNLPTGETLIQRFRAYHYGVSGGTKLGCETFGSIFSIAKYYIESLSNFYGEYFTCYTPIIPRALFRTVGLTTDPFPGEFRPNSRISEIKMKTPAGTAYTPGSSRYSNNDASVLPDPDVVQKPDGDELTWSGTKLPICDTNPPRFSFEFAPQCYSQIIDRTPVPVYSTFTNYEFDAGNAVVKQFTQNHAFYNYTSDLSIQADITQDAYSQTVSWPVTLCEVFGEWQQYNWMTFEPPSNVTLISAKMGDVELEFVSYDPNAPQKKMIKVGGLYNQCQTIVLTATYVDCKENITEDIGLRAGHSCGGYPTNPDEASCSNTRDPVSGVIRIRYKNADLAQVVNKINPTSNLCESIPFEVELLSAGIGNMQEVFTLLELPKGIVFKPGTGQYKLAASSNWVSIPSEPTQLTEGGASGLGWNLTTSLLGGNEFINQTSIWLRFELEAQCAGTFLDNFDPGLPVVITSLGRTNCGDIKVRRFLSKIEINGFNLTGNELVPNVEVGNICQNGFGPKVHISVTNREQLPSTQQDLVVTMPQGVEYLGPLAGAVTPFSVLKVAGITTITWKLNDPIAPSQTITGFNFAFSLTDTNLSSILVETRTFIFGSGTCSTTGETCSLRATTGLSQITATVLSENCYNCQAPTPQTEVVCAARESTFSAWNGANVAVVCGGDEYVISNNGTAGLTSDLTYTAYYSNSSQVVVSIVEEKFRLNVGESLAVKHISNGLTITRLEVEQAPFNIHNSGVIFSLNQSGSGAYCGRLGSVYLSPAPLSWNFGDGTTATGSIVNHIFTDARDYDVILTYCNGLQQIIAYKPLDCRINDLNLNAECSNDRQMYRWLCTNPNDIGVKVTYTLLNSPFHGSFIAPPGDTTFFTPVMPGKKELTLEWLNEQQETVSVTQTNYYEQECTIQECENCYSSFKLLKGKEYILSAWVREEAAQPVTGYENASISLDFTSTLDSSTLNFAPSGVIVDGWQRLWTKFIVPDEVAYMTIRLVNDGNNQVYFDDVRIHPFNGSMKSFVYDPVSQRLMAELDENNYATFYEYDEEGSLIRVKKETERGVKTIQESRNNTVKTSND
jgi:uncharacterized repeat protein (TIGR01451 family)